MRPGKQHAAPANPNDQISTTTSSTRSGRVTPTRRNSSLDNVVYSNYTSTCTVYSGIAILYMVVSIAEVQLQVCVCVARRDPGTGREVTGGDSRDWIVDESLRIGIRERFLTAVPYGRTATT